MNARFELRLDAEQKAEIERAAQALNISAAEWIRSTLSRALKSTPPASVQQGTALPKPILQLEPIPPAPPGRQTPTDKDHEGLPAPNPHELPFLYQSRLCEWAAQQPNSELSRNAAEVIFQNYLARWKPQPPAR